MNITYHKNLDGVRAIAALMVMVFHLSAVVPDTTPLAGVLKLSVSAHMGVTLFFVLSGFLITRILISTRDDTHFFKNFYLRRSLRIFPLYYLFLLIFYFAIPVVTDSPFTPVKEQLIFYTYFQDFAMTFDWKANGPGHYWSLAVEEHFYLFWPLIVYYCNNKSLYKVIAGIVAVAFALRIVLIMGGYPVYYFTFTRFDSLAMGALLALMETKQAFKKQNAIKFLLFLLVVLIPTAFAWFRMTGEGNQIVQGVKDVPMTMIAFAFIGYVLSIEGRHVVNRLLESRIFNYTGKISYGIYVYHVLVLQLCITFFGSSNWILTLVASCLTTYLVASLSFHLFESRFLKLKKYFDYKSGRGDLSGARLNVPTLRYDKDAI